MRILLIDGHPDPVDSHFVHGLADAYAAGAAEAGHAVTRIDVARLDIPILRTKQAFEHAEPPPDIAAAQAAFRAAEHIVLIYPLWLGTMPGLVKLFLEQVFRPGFAFSYDGGRLPRKALGGRSARIVVTMAMPALAYRWFYGAHSLRSLTRNILHFVGIRPVRWTLIGGVEGPEDRARGRWIDRLRRLGATGG